MHATESCLKLAEGAHGVIDSENQLQICKSKEPGRIILHVCHTRSILETFSLAENLASPCLQDRSQSGIIFAQNNPTINHQSCSQIV